MCWPPPSGPSLSLAGGGVQWSNAGAASCAASPNSLALQSSPPTAVPTPCLPTIPTSSATSAASGSAEGHRGYARGRRHSRRRAPGSDSPPPSTTSRYIPADAKIIQIEIDPEEIGRNYPVAVGIEGDAGAVSEGPVGRTAAERTPRKPPVGRRGQELGRPARRPPAGVRSGWTPCR